MRSNSCGAPVPSVPGGERGQRRAGAAGAAGVVGPPGGRHVARRRAMVALQELSERSPARVRCQSPLDDRPVRTVAYGDSRLAITLQKKPEISRLGANPLEVVTMKIKCPACGEQVTVTVKGHASGTKTFRELSRAQQRASIAKTARDLKAMREIYTGQR